VQTFGVPMITVKRYVKLYRGHGAKGFYGPQPRHSSASVLKGPVLEQAQRLLDEGRSVPEVAADSNLQAAHHPGQRTVHDSQTVRESERRRSERRGINVREQRDTVDDGVACVPPTFRACAINGHLRSEAHPFSEFAPPHPPHQSLPVCAFQ
jgi:hypothetical protein